MKFTNEQIEYLKKEISVSSRIFIIPEKFNTTFEQKAFAAGRIDTAYEFLAKLIMLETEEGDKNGA